jgi:hypothetical protein
MGLQTLAGPTTRLSLLICPQRHISVLSRLFEITLLGCRRVRCGELAAV